MRTKIGDVFYLKWEDEDRERLYFEGIVKRIDNDKLKIIRYFDGDFHNTDIIFSETKRTDGVYEIKYPNENPEYFI